MTAVANKTDTREEAATTTLRAMPQSQAPKRGSFTTDAYRLHGFRVLDVEGHEVGIVDWIWKDPESGHGEFLGVHLRWLRGTTRAIPTLRAEIDHAASTIRVAYTAAQIKRGKRFKIDRPLSAREKRRIYFSYQQAASTLRELVPSRDAVA